MKKVSLLPYHPPFSRYEIYKYNELHHKNKKYCSIKAICAFLHKEGYNRDKVTKDSISLKYPSEKACISFIMYKAPLFENVEFYIKENGLNDWDVIIKEVKHLELETKKSINLKTKNKKPL